MTVYDPFKREICGVPLAVFKTPPTPEELGSIVGHWTAETQAEFFACLAQTLHDFYGCRVASRIEIIADALNAFEYHHLDGKGSQLITYLSEALVERAARQSTGSGARDEQS